MSWIKNLFSSRARTESALAAKVLATETRTVPVKSAAYHEIFISPNGAWTVRVYARKGGLLEEVSGVGGKPTAQQTALNLLQKYEVAK